jgi:glycosyltransferase involved in cell wall biosynthesis
MSVRWAPAGPVVSTAGDVPAPPAGVPVKLLHVITRLEAGAGGNTLLSAAGMDRRRYEPWIAGGAGGELWAAARDAGVRTVQIPGFGREIAPASDLRVLGSLVRLMRRERFGIVHLHSAKAGALGRAAAVLAGVPVVVYTLHGRDPWWPAPDRSASQLADVMPRGLRALRLTEALLRPVTHRFVAVAPTVARDAVLAGVATAGRISVAPSAVDLSQIPHEADPTVRAELGIADDVPVVGTVGRLDAQKAPLDFVRMAAALTVTNRGTRFVMVGDGPLRPRAEALAADLGVNVLFTGQRPDAPRVSSTFDVYVVTSLYEGVGRAVTEAMASGRPVAATAVDGVVDLVEPGATGLLAASRDPAGLAAAVGYLLTHPAEAAQMGKQGRERVRGLFTPARMCAALDQVYADLLGLEPLDGADADESRLSDGTRDD